MKKLEIESVPYQRRRVLLSAIYDGERVGSLDYLPPLRANLSYALGLLRVKPEYQGLGVAKSILTEFTKRSGVKAEVSATVTHDETLDYLEDHDPNQLRDKREVLLITDPEEINGIPIARVLAAGNIKVTKFRVVYNSRQVQLSSGNIIYVARLKGITR